MASRSLGTLTLDLVAKIGGYTEGLDKAGRDSEKLAARNRKAMKQIEEDSKKVGNAIKAGIAGITIGSFIGKFIQESRDAQNEQAQLAAVLKSTGEAAGFSQEKLNGMAEEFAGASILGDGEINKAQARLLSYTGVVGEEFPRALQAAIDMSSRLGLSLEQSSETIGKALDVPSEGLSALSKQGFRFTEDQKKLVESFEATGRTAEAQGIILAALETAYGGAALAARNTFGGSITALKEQLNTLMSGSDGSIDGASSAINELTDTMSSEETKQAFETLTAAIATAVGWLAKGAVGFSDFGKGIAETLARWNHGSDSEIGRLESNIQRASSAIESIENELKFKDKYLLGIGAGGLNKELDTYKKDLDRFKKLKSEAEKNLAGTVSQPSSINTPDRPVKTDTSFYDNYVSSRQSNAQQLSEALKIESQAFRRATLNVEQGSNEYVAALNSHNVKVTEIQKKYAGPKATKVQKSEFERYAETLQKEIIKVDDLTRVEEILAEVQSGRLGKVTTAQREYLVGLAAQVEGIKASDEAWSYVIPSMEKAAESSQKLLLDNQALAKSYLDIIDPTRELGTEIQKIKDLAAGGFLSPDESVKAIDKITEAWKKNNDEMDMFTRKAAENIQDSIGDGLVDIMDGNFKSIGSGFAKMLKQMTADALAANIARSLFGSMVSGGSGGGLLGGLIPMLGGLFGAGAAGSTALSAGMGAGASLTGAATSGIGFNLPSFAVGTPFVPYDMTANIHKGERILTASENKEFNATPAQGAGVNFAPVYHIDSRSDRTAVMQDMQRVSQMANADLVDKLQRAGRL